MPTELASNPYAAKKAERRRRYRIQCYRAAIIKSVIAIAVTIQLYFPVYAIHYSPELTFGTWCEFVGGVVWVWASGATIGCLLYSAIGEIWDGVNA